MTSPAAEGKTPDDLFGFTRQRKKSAGRRVLMHVIDAGDHGCVSDDAGIAVYKCGRCGHETDWTPFRTFTEAKRGIPCPKCNPTTPQASP